jgi:hypothetical protein
MAASDDTFLVRSKFAMAATGMVASSSARKKINRLPLDTRKNIPSNAESMSIKNYDMCPLLLSQFENNNEINQTPRFRIFF